MKWSGCSLRQAAQLRWPETSEPILKVGDVQDGVKECGRLVVVGERNVECAHDGGRDACLQKVLTARAQISSCH